MSHAKEECRSGCRISGYLTIAADALRPQAEDRYAVPTERRDLSGADAMRFINWFADPEIGVWLRGKVVMG